MLMNAHGHAQLLLGPVRVTDWLTRQAGWQEAGWQYIIVIECSLAGGSKQFWHIGCGQKIDGTASLTYNPVMWAEPCHAPASRLIIVIKSSSLFANICDVRANFGQFYCTLKPTGGRGWLWSDNGGLNGRGVVALWRCGAGWWEVYKYNFVNVRYGNEKDANSLAKTLPGECQVDEWLKATAGLGPTCQE